jgi:hypothetical protein
MFFILVYISPLNQLLQPLVDGKTYLSGLPSSIAYFPRQTLSFPRKAQEN